MTAANLILVQATRDLRAAGVDDPARDARILLAHVLGVDRGRLTLILPDPVTPAQAEDFAKAITARAARQPVAQIIGKRAFYGREFIVTPDVLDPRPDTELLVDTALEQAFDRVLDLGTGSGCILLTLLAERAGTTGLGGDLSAKALAVAAQNAGALGLAARARFAQGSWFDVAGAARFDLIVSNPPYIAADEMPALAADVRDWEPHLALTPGGDGLDPYRILTAQAGRYLVPGGRLIVEIGAGQGGAVRDMFIAAGLQNPQLLQDLSGHDRVVSAVWPAGAP